MATSISMFVHDHPNTTHKTYRVTFYEHTIETLVTATPSSVDTWISNFERLHSHRHPSRAVLIGLDVEWRPSFTRNLENPIATLQLCFGRNCLIFQIRNSLGIPQSLVNLLRNPSYHFAGVGVGDDVEKLRRHYNLVVAKTVDLRVLAADTYGVRELRNAGLKELAIRVLGKEVNKPQSVTLSRWDNECLSPAQVEYAAVDAFLSFEIGRVLICGNGN